MMWSVGEAGHLANPHAPEKRMASYSSSAELIAGGMRLQKSRLVLSLAAVLTRSTSVSSCTGRER